MSATRLAVVLGIVLLILIAIVSYSLYLVKGYPAVELRKTSCYSAEQGGTCTTRLADLSITAEQCCKEFGKCCGS